MYKFPTLREAIRFVIERAGRPLRAPEIRDAIIDESLWLRSPRDRDRTLRQIHRRVDGECSDEFFKLLDSRIALHEWRIDTELRTCRNDDVGKVDIEDEIEVEIGPDNLTWRWYLMNERRHEQEFERRLRRAEGNIPKSIAFELLTKWSRDESVRRKRRIALLITFLEVPDFRETARNELEKLADMTSWQQQTHSTT